MQVLPVQSNTHYKNNQCSITYRSSKVIDEGDYVKIPKEKYKKDILWKYVDYTMVSSCVLYWLYKAFKYNGKP